MHHGRTSASVKLHSWVTAFGSKARKPSAGVLAPSGIRDDVRREGLASAMKRSSAKETRSPSTLAAYSQTHPPYWTLSGLGDCPNDLIRSFPSSEKVSTLVYTDAEAALFTEVPRRVVLRSSSSLLRVTKDSMRARLSL
jgi:hypothetical protein